MNKIESGGLLRGYDWRTPIVLGVLGMAFFGDYPIYVLVVAGSILVGKEIISHIVRRKGT